MRNSQLLEIKEYTMNNHQVTEETKRETSHPAWISCSAACSLAKLSGQGVVFILWTKKLTLTERSAYPSQWLGPGLLL